MNWIRHSSLSAKIIGTTFFTGVSLLIVGIINFSTLRSVLSHYNHVAQVNLEKTRQLGQLKAVAVQLQNGIKNIFELKSRSARETDLSPLRTDLETLTKEMSLILEGYAKTEFVDNEKALYEPIETSWSQILTSLLQLNHTDELSLTSPGSRLASEASQASKAPEASQEFLPPLLDKLTTQIVAIDALNSFQNAEAAKWVASAEMAASKGQLVALSAIIVFFLLSIGAGLILSRLLSSRMRALAEELNNEVDEVAKASKGLSTTAQVLSQSTVEQAASLEETAAAIEQMASMVGKNSDNASNTAALASKSEKSARRGEEVVKTMIQAMASINSSNKDIMNAINQGNQEISDIIKVITEIGSKTKIINDIVFQTKLLSFNASVEAARAGEHGKGFAVVAEEVGNLAEVSGKASKEISALLDESIGKVEQIVTRTQERVEGLVEEGHTRVNEGTEVAEECGRVLHEIVDHVTQVTSMAGEISAASSEQSKGVNEISKAMNQLDHATQKNAQISDTTAQASDQLSNQALHLRNSLAKLIVEIEGAQHGAPQLDQKRNHQSKNHSSHHSSYRSSHGSNHGSGPRSDVALTNPKSLTSRSGSIGKALRDERPLKAPKRGAHANVNPDNVKLFPLHRTKSSGQTKSHAMPTTNKPKLGATPSFDDPRFEGPE